MLMYFCFLVFTVAGEGYDRSNIEVGPIIKWENIVKNWPIFLYFQYISQYLYKKMQLAW